MPIEVTMPRLSDTMQAGTIVRWAVKEGQKVKSGETLADIETDKATMEQAAFDDGVLAYAAVPEGKNEEIMASEDGARRLAGFMLRRHADRVQATSKAGRATILFHFDH